MQSEINSIQLEVGRLGTLKLSPRPRECDIDDYIGMESCVDLKDHHAPSDIPPTNSSESNMGANNKRDKMWGKKRKDYPPSIPLLVRTENLASHMPWVWKRHYTADGRLILTEEKVRHHEYFRAHRSDGRLMLQLVAMDDPISNENVEAGNGGIESSSDHSQDEADNDDGDDCIVKEEDGDENEAARMVGGGSEAGKCFKYGDVRGRDPAFMFGVAVSGSLSTVQS